MPVFINLKNELKNEDFIEREFSIPFNSLGLPEEYSSEKENVDVHLYIIKEKDGYLVSLTVNSDIQLECSRCLESFNMDLNGTSNIFLSKRKLIGDSELHEKDLIMEYLEDEEHFNLSELLREEILVQTPMKPLCDEKCKGICPVCGSNRNENQCICEEKLKRKESPFAKLKTLIEKKETKKN
ncbi:YceD family protein [Persephonella sp.]